MGEKSMKNVNAKIKRVLVLGASGMLGNAMFRYFSNSSDFEAFGTIRSNGSAKLFIPSIQPHLISGVDVENLDCLLKVFGDVKPDIVINCIGLVKQLAAAEDPLLALPINTLLPHRLKRICALSNARLVLISTDCVFSGSKGMYAEDDHPDARDVYGLSKYFGEVVDSATTITLRTSIIGHEMSGNHSLINWFLAQNESVNGYTNAIFSGLPTVELARVVRDFVVPNDSLSGLYHVSAEPISKYDLLQAVSKEYCKKIEIVPSRDIIIDRSLDSSRFRLATGYMPESWKTLVKKMHQFG